MAFQPLSPAAERRITLLAILPAVGGDLDAALSIFDAITEDGRFFDEEGRRQSNPTPQRSGRSERPASSSRPSNGGSQRGRDQRGAFTGQMRDPDGQPTEKQVGLLLRLTDEYSEDEVWDMTKQQVSDLIQQGYSHPHQSEAKTHPRSQPGTTPTT